MDTQQIQWWLARAGSQPEGPFDRSTVIARLGAGAAGWLVCRVGGNAWGDPHADPELAALLPPLPPPVPGASAAASQAYAPPPQPPLPPAAPATVADPNKGLIIFLHISQLAGYIIPGLGWMLPLVLWLTNRDKPEVDRHGKEVVNFMIIVVPAILISSVLMLVLIGFVLLPVVLIGQLVCVILAVVKASNNEFFRYPVPFRAIS